MKREDMSLEILISQWIPSYADILYRNDGVNSTIIVSAHSGKLSIHRFFKVGNYWDVSEDYAEHIDDILELCRYHSTGS